MKVDVENLLPSVTTVTEQPIDSGDGRVGFSQGFSDLLSECGEVCERLLIKVGQRGHLLHRNDEGVSLAQWIDVKEGDHPLATMDETGWDLVAEDFRED